MLAAYRHAVRQRYRFFSYGDAMFVEPSPRGAGAAGRRVMFEVTARSGLARRGRLSLRRGTVETPVFMPVGTYGTVKAMTPEELTGLGASIVLGNTFHLMLRPGTEVIRAHGGLHGFMHWPGPILTDSGGFQVFSLAELRKLSEDGVRFRSPVNGDAVFLSPEISMQVQIWLHWDEGYAFDSCLVTVESATCSFTWLPQMAGWWRSCDCSVTLAPDVPRDCWACVQLHLPRAAGVCSAALPDCLCCLTCVLGVAGWPACWDELHPALKADGLL